MNEYRITRVNYVVPNLDALDGFYIDVLGMRRSELSDGVAYAFAHAESRLAFRLGDVPAFDPERDLLYWKVGITVGALDYAISHVRRHAVTVSEPTQFCDIGYLAHLRDPNGLPIELLQRGFKGNDVAAPHGHPIGAQATLAHLTLRVTDLAAAKTLFGDSLGMRLMSVQPVPSHGFSLYFYAWSAEPLPHPELRSVDNREWLWARPYTLIELQHVDTSLARGALSGSGRGGFEGFCYGNEQGRHIVDRARLRQLVK